MGKLVSTLFGTKAPKVSTQASDDAEAARKKAKKSKTQQLATEGAILGDELQAGQVQNPNTIFGN